MLNSLLNNQLVRFIRYSAFIKALVVLGGVLTLTFLVQAYFVITSETTDERGTATITVNVGEMYFEQVDSALPQGVIEAEIGDTIEFVNVGNLRHSATIDELDFDEVLYPGDTVTLTLERAVNEAFVNCKFHSGHDAVLTVSENGTHSSAYQPSDIDAGDLPLRSMDDAIDQLEYKMVDGVKEFHLSAEHIRWKYSDDHILEAWAYQGQLPGPEIRVTEGDDVRIIFENRLPVATTVHWHGVDVPNEADGVPHVTQDPVEPGETFVYEFSAIPAGTRFYHTHGSHHGDEWQQMDMGLSGAFIIEPRDYVAPDREYTMVLTERPEAGLWPINGRTYPNPEVLEVSEGDRVRIRMINAGSSSIHPMHLHGHQFEVVAIDGNPVPPGNRQLRNNQPLTPGEVYDIEFTANNPGVWMFHCHELHHAAGGMIAKVVYE